MKNPLDVLKLHIGKGHKMIGSYSDDDSDYDDEYEYINGTDAIMANGGVDEEKQLSLPYNNAFEENTKENVLPSGF